MVSKLDPDNVLATMLGLEIPHWLERETKYFLQGYEDLSTVNTFQNLEGKLETKKPEKDNIG